MKRFTGPYDLAFKQFILKGRDEKEFEMQLKTPVLWHYKHTEKEFKEEQARRKEIDEDDIIWRDPYSPEFEEEHAFLKEQTNLLEHLFSSMQLLHTFKLTPAQVAKKLRRITNPTHYKEHEEHLYEWELYARYKPSKQHRYTMRAIERPDVHPCCQDIAVKNDFTISRPETSRETELWAGLLTNANMYCVYEDEAEQGDDKAIATTQAIQNSDRQAYDELDRIEKKLGPTTFTFTNILPHLIEQHCFFPNTPKYNIDIPFFLQALGYNIKKA
jgi:hypothetical protein